MQERIRPGKAERALPDQCFYLSCLKGHFYHIQAGEALKSDGQHLYASLCSAKKCCHQKDMQCFKNGQSSAMTAYRMRIQGVFIEQLACQHL